MTNPVLDDEFIVKVSTYEGMVIVTLGDEGGMALTTSQAIELGESIIEAALYGEEDYEQTFVN